MVSPWGRGLQERYPLVQPGGQPGADGQGADAGHLEVFLSLHLDRCVWAQCFLPHQAAAWARPCFPRWLLGAHSGVQGSPSTDLVMELEGPSLRSSPAIWGLFSLHPCCRPGVLTPSGVICGLSGLRYLPGYAEGGEVPFFLPLHTPLDMLALAPPSPENSNQVMSQTSGSWEVGERNAERRSATSHITLKWSLASTGQLPLTSHLPHGLDSYEKMGGTRMAFDCHSRIQSG